MTAAGAGGRPRRAAVLALLVGAGISATTTAAAGEVDIVGPAAGGTYRVGVESLQERRFRTVYRQAHDLSCGAAALASLLTYHYRRPVSEEEVAAAMRAAGDPAKIDRLGFSLLDMQRYLAGRGLAADGFRVNLDRLAAAGLPAITLMEAEGYRHFVLIKGIRGDTVLVGDPAKGIRVLRRQAFEVAWSGIAFLIRDGQTLARTAFNRDEEWAAPAPAPLGTALDRGNLADITGVRAPFPRF